MIFNSTLLLKPLPERPALAIVLFLKKTGKFAIVNPEKSFSPSFMQFHGSIAFLLALLPALKTTSVPLFSRYFLLMLCRHLELLCYYNCPDDWRWLSGSVMLGLSPSDGCFVSVILSVTEIFPMMWELSLKTSPR